MADAADNKPGTQDQSMEEILQSIRRIIAEENEEAGATPEGGSSVLELTEMLDEAPPPAADLGTDILNHIDDALTPHSPPPIPEPTPVVIASVPPPPRPEYVPESSDALLSNAAVEASAAAMKILSQSMQKDVGPRTESPTFRSGATVEDLVLESLKPMLKSWLDANLPAIVERIVEKEVRRLSASL